MSTRPPKKVAIDVNPATDTMEEVSLHCRAFGHLWRVHEPSRTEKFRTLAEGYIEYRRVCENGCGCTWTMMYSVPGFELLKSARTWPSEGYKMPAGHGRLPRREALSARFVRQHPTLVA